MVPHMKANKDRDLGIVCYQSHTWSQSGSQVKTAKSGTKAQKESLTAAVNHQEKAAKIQWQSKCLSFS